MFERIPLDQLLAQIVTDDIDRAPPSSCSYSNNVGTLLNHLDKLLTPARTARRHRYRPKKCARASPPIQHGLDFRDSIDGLISGRLRIRGTQAPAAPHRYLSSRQGVFTRTRWPSAMIARLTKAMKNVGVLGRRDSDRKVSAQAQAPFLNPVHISIWRQGPRLCCTDQSHPRSSPASQPARRFTYKELSPERIFPASCNVKRMRSTILPSCCRAWGI